MSIPDDHKKLVQALRDAFAEGRTVLMECRYVTTRDTVTVLCMKFEKEGKTVIIPVAKLFDGEPTEEIEPIIPGEDS